MKHKAVLKRVAASVGLTACIAGVAFVSSATGMSPDEALQRLMDGNQRYVKNQMTGSKRSDLSARKALAKSQKPYAIVLSCSDSRVPPEIVFDKGLGEIFVVRVAGNIPDPVVLGSIEYAAEHLGAPLVMVLGHERCGAVTAAVNDKGHAEGNIGAIIKAIAPAVKDAEGNCQPCKDDIKCKDQFVECAISSNVKLVAKSLTQNSTILKHLAEEGKLKIVPAKYDLDDGQVELLK